MVEEKLQHSGQRGGTLAIDLGSTTTVVAYQGATSTTADLLNLPAICSRAGEIPSLVWNATQQPLIGRQVLESGLNDSSDIRLHRDFKGRIGQADAPDHQAARWAGEQLLQQIWSRLPPDLAIERLVLTAPVECYRAYRSWLLEACTPLPVTEIALVDEPTAAAMGAGLPAGSTLLVVDLGGSTLDLALVALEGGEGRAAPIAQLLRLGGRSLGDNSRQMLRTAKVLGKAGLRLGGRDIDRWIVDRCCPGQPASALLLNTAERLKCRLSDTTLGEREQLMEVAVDGQEHVLRLSRSELNSLLRERGFADALEQLLETCLAGGRRNNCSLEDLNGVVAVGACAAFLGPFKDLNQFGNHVNVESIELVLTSQLDSGTTAVNGELNQGCLWWIVHRHHVKNLNCIFKFSIGIYILNIPYFPSGKGAFLEAARQSPRTSRVSRGSMMPSSQSRAVE